MYIGIPVCFFGELYLLHLFLTTCCVFDEAMCVCADVDVDSGMYFNLIRLALHTECRLFIVEITLS